MPIPQYITSEQAKSLLTAAQQQGIDPASALKSLTDNGHIIQGFNDSDYNNSQISQQTPFGQQLAGVNADSQSKTPSTSFLDQGNGGQAMQDFEAPLVGASKGLLGAGAGVVGAIGKLFGSTRVQQAAQNFQQKNTQSYGTGLQGALQTGGKALGESLPYVAAGAATGGLADAAGAAASTGAEALGAGSTLSGLAGVAGQGAVGALAQGATGYLTSGGDTKAAEAAALGGAVAPGLSKYILGPALESVQGAFSGGANGGNEGAVNAANNIIKNASDYKGAIGPQLSQGAQDLSDLNPDITAQVNPALAQQLGDLKGTDLETLGKGQLTPADAQKVASSLPNTPEGNALERTFRASMQNAFNEADAATVDSPKVGDKFEQLYTDARTQYGVYNNLADTIGLGSNPSEADALTTINKIKALQNDPNGRIILKRAIQDWADSTGTDLSSDVKASQYVNTLPKYSKAIGKLLLKGGELVIGVDVAKHLGL